MSNGDAGDRPITAAEADDLRQSLEELRAANQALQEANTERERQSARDDIGEAREDLDALAGRLGISRSALDSSIAAAKRAERKDELRPIIAELLEEARADEQAQREEREAVEREEQEAAEREEQEASEREAAEAAAAAAASERKPKPAATPDNGPSKPHWSEKGVSELLRG